MESGELLTLRVVVEPQGAKMHIYIYTKTNEGYCKKLPPRLHMALERSRR